ncbi:tRNA 5-methoxyuridine(34)/uridine 5-oxyacetic acid(34) synthase CmoB [Thiomicrorhabdus sediminis]|uniref:tRNA U34 carboxymethyltransferase n=1 Tax=Thiomicrorhabdus sediminis TaxID=2580412 RepID=A0A4P9K2Y8_9GAMM|nr:tRNA 5-methoxyuridine(34)/uridine 5-oxyacetic acid(34) synthase CmoB [Thiomicrorhabdus sediminis]QCU89188.1 tRNA 5-methoxyuridine(34)/uridine 5-oxyacetic acid(34) synthase CmoB [Thiomicrorhabdus sediminis]
MQNPFKIHFENLWQALHDNEPLNSWSSLLQPALEAAVAAENNGNLVRWSHALEQIKAFPNNANFAIDQASVSASSASSLSEQEKLALTEALKGLHPWRKGPFDLHDIHIDTEWRSDWKWDRVYPHIASLENRTVLDIGCGSGYHLWRMLGSGAKLAVGVDPSLLSMMQFLSVEHFIKQQQPAYFLPLTLEQLPIDKRGGGFDSVFSMGVLYHRRSPIDHIYDLKSQLRGGGELILETLVIPEDYGQMLLPEDRYAQMRNVWFLPNVKELQHWLQRCGFINVRCVDLNPTSIDEQRTTEWMEWNSLESFLDPQDHSKTIEGYPAPLRAVMVCNKPQ